MIFHARLIGIAEELVTCGDRLIARGYAAGISIQSSSRVEKCFGLDVSGSRQDGRVRISGVASARAGRVRAVLGCGSTASLSIAQRDARAAGA